MASGPFLPRSPGHQPPPFTRASNCTARRAMASISIIACSATLRSLEPLATITATPRAVQAGTSTESNPTP